MFQKLQKENSGAALVEYIVLMSLISVVATGAVYKLGSEVREVYDTTTTEISLQDPDQPSEPAVPTGVSPVIVPGQGFTFDTYLDPGTEVHTVDFDGPAVDTFVISGVGGLEIDQNGVIRVTDVTAFGSFGSTVVATVTATTAEGLSDDEQITITRLDASDPLVDWYIWQDYEVVWTSSNGWMDYFGSSTNDPDTTLAQVHQFCIDEAQRLNDEHAARVYQPWETPEIIVYDWFDNSAGESKSCNGRKTQTMSERAYFNNTTSSTNELWWQSEAVLRTGTYMSGDIENARFRGQPISY